MPGDAVKTVVQTYRRIVSPKPMAARVDLTGRNMIVTGGAQDSIGYQVAKTLASWGANVVVTSLGDTGALQRTLREELRTSGGDGDRVTAKPLDLADSRDVSDFAEWYATHCGGELHVLVNNAGVFKDIARRSKTPVLARDGVEIHWRVNFLGTFPPHQSADAAAPAGGTTDRRRPRHLHVLGCAPPGPQ